MGFIKKTLDVRLQRQVAEADHFVKGHYKLADLPLPNISVGIPRDAWSHSTDRSGAIGSLIRMRRWVDYNIFYAAACNLESRNIHYSHLYVIYSHSRELRGNIAHELAHSYSSATPLGRKSLFSTGFASEDMALNCAFEGLAVAAQKSADSCASGRNYFLEALRMPLRLVINLVRQTLLLLTEPEKILLNFISNWINSLSKETKQKLGVFIDEHDFFARFVSPHSSGYLFVAEVMKKVGGSEKAFKLLCYHPPETMAEIFHSDLYFARKSHAVIHLQADYHISMPLLRSSPS
ncbi:MAG: hypothetical protein WCT31_02635 [Candidatus Micrarchaeia archaeon]|jgi:hypothetical protein